MKLFRSKNTFLLLFSVLFIPTFSLIQRVSASTISSQKESNVLIGNWIEGFYSNIAQHEKDLLNNKPTAIEGGHEFVEANISRYVLEDRPNGIDSAFIASYWYGSDESKVPFRFRMYSLESDKSGKYASVMKLYKPCYATNEKLRSCSFDLSKYYPTISEFELLDGCNIGWTKIENDPSGEGLPVYRGVLINGEVIISSQNDPNQKLKVYDELHLWQRRLWINDRVYTSEGKQIIGNLEGIPYDMVKTE